MKLWMILLSLVVVTGCSMRDMQPMTGKTAQLHNLNDPDGDGVVLARERCTGTIAKAEIDNYGCGTVKKYQERRELKIQFANDSAYLAPKYYGQIETLADFLTQYPDTKVVIEGHCSKVGDYQHNLELSQNRAEAVVNVLVKQFSINPSRLTAKGYSYDRPVDDSHDSYAHSRNRRVMAEVTGEKSAADYKWDIYTVDKQEKY
ncbi:OmpA family protein [Parashewanella curva]|uniref:OmpA family protein n=1 Tax=Parashewanella curva TaxID=2338552 RepID=A0A3L8PYF3_9GAMM|nr:OmpA family protein [Parashewanella curva]RLV60295.1 OmpA family protein [Parashewanella curva]